MPRRSPWKPEGIIQPDGGPRSLKTLGAKFIEHLRVQQYTDATAVTRARDIGYFIAWCEERGIARAAEVTRPIIQRYQRALFYFRTEKGQPLNPGTQKHRMVSVTRWFRWLTRSDFLLYNPAADIELPRGAMQLPALALTPEEVEKVMAVPDLRTPAGVRDRCILEVFYSTGIRRQELCNLRVNDIDHARGLVLVKLGKGKKDRVVPIGERALTWVNKYVTDVRPQLAVEPDEGYLFLAKDGQPIPHSSLGDMVKRHIDAANTGKKGSCHLLRHSCATAMLEGGADIRWIQEQLGHADLSQTALYAKANVTKLKAIHTATHPSAKLPQRPVSDGGGKEDPEGGR